MASPLTFVIVEFLGNADSNAMKVRWQRELRYTDLTPPLPGAGSGSVASFSTKGPISHWSTFQSQLVDLEPDWIFLSGHHGRRLASDWDKDAETFAEHAAKQTQTGYFNKWYYEGKWEGETGPNSQFEIYMTTSHGPSGPLEAEDNPFFARVHTACRGVVLNGCNSLSYPVARKAWIEHFPNALIIGNNRTVKGGKDSIRPLLLDSVCGDEFYRDPPAGDDDMAKAAYQINLALPAYRGAIRLQRAGSFSEYDATERVARTFSYPGGLINATYPPKK